MRLLAISDLHLGSPTNRDALAELGDYPEDWLIVAGDVAESFQRIGDGLAALRRRFAKVIWVPGNHELWSLPGIEGELRGEARYQGLVDLARAQDVLTPEDPWPIWHGEGGPVRIVPIFTLYDYSFAPPGLAPAEVIAWAGETNIHPVDEVLLHPDPHPNRVAWCRDRLARTEARLAALEPGLPSILVSHWPLREDLVRIPRVPRFAPWCGTTATRHWPERFGAIACVYGHLHVRGRRWLDGIRFEEVSLGYPRQWQPERGMAAYVRQILPLVAEPEAP
ncbi:metallophosphoesterase family protein [Geminicoccus roseus]|uniref:metallophosphoesterase family protein n=1 Tax=Geminicoccus roseus TaxID=404900 RepID=UPI0004052044|nr:metallophosphoesterase [Geminicoccus roseus]